MSDVLKVLQAGDLAGLEMEKARAAVEHARQVLDDARAKFEFAKQAFDDVAESAEEAGLAKAKFKKLIEERTAILWASGLVSSTEGGAPVRPAKVARAPKKKSETNESSSRSSADILDFATGEEPAEEALVN